MSATTPTHLNQEDLAERYLVQTADISEGIERILKGEELNLSFPRTINVLLEVFGSAHKFLERERKFPPLDLKDVIIERMLRDHITNISAFQLITKLYSETTADDSLEKTNLDEYLIRGESIVRNLAYQTQDLPNLQKISKQARKDLDILKQFYKKWEEKGNTIRSARYCM